MGYANSTWMKFILEYFDPIVSNVANSYRLQEECDVLRAGKLLHIKYIYKLYNIYIYALYAWY